MFFIKMRMALGELLYPLFRQTESIAVAVSEKMHAYKSYLTRQQLYSSELLFIFKRLLQQPAQGKRFKKIAQLVIVDYVVHSMSACELEPCSWLLIDKSSTKKEIACVQATATQKTLAQKTKLDCKTAGATKLDVFMQELCTLKEFFKLQDLSTQKAATWQPYLLTLNFRKRTLCVGLVTARRGCVFSFTSGMFLPGYKTHILTKEFKKKRLKYLRKLKPKKRRVAKKKTEVPKWKYRKNTKAVKLLMLRYVNRLLILLRQGHFIVFIRGPRRDFRKYLRTIFLDNARTLVKRGTVHIEYVAFLNKFKCVLTERAIKRRLRKKMQKKIRIQ